MSKKKLLSLSMITIMVAILSFGSLAWFTDNDSATNKFSVGGAGEDDADKIFSVEVKENVDGEEQPVDGMDFEDILPGDNFKKEAYITNTGSYDQYIRVTMTISDWALIKDVVDINFDDNFANNWKIVSDESNGVKVNEAGNLKSWNSNSLDSEGNLVVIMYLNKVFEPGDTIDILDYVGVSKDATQNDFVAEGFADGFKIDIVVDAVQTKNILDSYGRVEWENAQKSFLTI